MKRPAAFRCSLVVAGLGVAAGLSWSQQAKAPNPPAPPWTAAELEAVRVVPPRAGKSRKITLFDGKTLQGWRGNPDWWFADRGVIVGKFHDRVPTSFLFTKDNYSDFRLTLASRMVESANHAGACFWGQIAQQGENQWYTRGPLVAFPNPSMWDYIERRGLRVYRPTLEKVTSQHEWVQVEILAQGNRVRTALNGVHVMEWRESDPSRIQEGPIGLQLHAWAGPQEVHYKDVVVETFPKEDRLLTLKK